MKRASTGGGTQTYRSIAGDDELTVRVNGEPSVGSPRGNAGAVFDFDRDALVVVKVPVTTTVVTVDVAQTARRMLNDSTEVDPSAPRDPDVTIRWKVKV